jgi:hypothetical protein
MFIRKVFVGWVSLSVFVYLTGPATPTSAAPFTSHFDDLIADLDARAMALSNSTDKVEQQQFKTLQKVLKTINGKKPSTSLATDIKILGSVAKTVVKSFPGDFTPPVGSLSSNLETALDGLTGDVQSQIDDAQSNLDAMAASTCKTKAQSTLDIAQAQLDGAQAAADFGGGAKLLGTALKTVSKAAKSTVKCSSQSGGGGGGGGGTMSGTLSCNASGAANDSFSAAFGNGFVIASLNQPAHILTITAGQMINNTTLTYSLSMYADNVNGPGTYPVNYATSFIQYNPLMTFFGAQGTISFTTADFANKKLVGTFGFTEPQQLPSGTGTVTVANGQFNISGISRNDSVMPSNNVMTATDNGFAFAGTCTGMYFQAISSLFLTGQHTLLTPRTIVLVVANPNGPGSYSVGLGSYYADAHRNLTLYQNDVSGTVNFSTLDIAHGNAEGTFTLSATQSTPPGTDTVTVINGHFKNSNINTQ